MMRDTLIARARRHGRLSQQELARRAGTSQPTLSAYERGLTSPTLAVAERIIRSSGHELDLVAQVNFMTHLGPRGEPFLVPNELWRLELTLAFTDVQLPSHLHWSGPSRVFQLADRQDRARVYEIVMREGTEADLLTYIDGALLLDLWSDLVLPAPLRAAWVPVVSRYIDEGLST